MTTVLLRRAALALALTSLLGACGKGDDQAPAPEATDTAAAPAQEAGATAAALAPTAAAAEGALAVADLDAYARGMTQELAVLKAAADKAAEARAKGDKEAETNAMLGMATLDADAEGAKAAGLDKPRYLSVKTAVETALGKLDMQAAMTNPQDQASLEELPAEQRQQIEASRAEMKAALGDPYAGLPADVAEAFKARQAELAQLRAQAIAIRLNAAQ